MMQPKSARPGPHEATTRTCWPAAHRTRIQHATLLLALAAACGEVEPAQPDAGANDADAGSDAPAGPATLRVNLQAPHDFGPVPVGGQSIVLQVTVRNAGAEASGPISLALGGSAPGEFRIVPTGDSTDCAGMRLAGGATCTAQVRFAPTMEGVSSARLDISAVPGGGVTVAVSGDGRRAAMLTASQSQYDFGSLLTGQPSGLANITVRNMGQEQSGSIVVALGGAHAGDFAIVPTGMANDCANARLTEQQPCIVQVRFRPTVASARTADLTVSANPGGTVTVALSGAGLTPGSLAIDMPASAMVDFGTREIGTGASSTPTTIRVRNTGGSPTGPLEVAIGGGANSYTTPTVGCAARLAANATCDVTVRFNPTAVGSVPATLTIRDTEAMTAASVQLGGTGSARIALTKTGAGAITSNPSGLSCGASCTTTQTGTFTQTPVALTATPEGGWVFTGWTGACAPSNPSPVCSVPLTQALTNVGGTFTQVFTLSVSAMGSGTVTSSMPGILCGDGNSDCSETYPVGTTVQLEAEPAAGWEVYSWVGTGVSCGAAARSCTVTMSQARNVTVTFRQRFTLTVSKAGAGVGTVTSDIGGINCGPACPSAAATFWDGDAVSLTQTAGADSAFVDWGNACTGAAACMLAMTANRTVTAEFKRQYVVTVNVSGTGAGAVTVQPGNFTCTSGTCTRVYDADANLTITATPSSSLDGVGTVSGACTATPCTVSSLSSAQTVNVSFVRYQCVPSTQTCSSGNFTQCDAAGTFVSYVVPNGAPDGTQSTLVMNNYRCPMGCHAGQPRCADVDASNGFNAALDSPATSADGIDLVLPRTMPAPPNPPGLVIVNTSTYDSATGETTITDGNGDQIRVPAEVILQSGTGYPAILVLKVRSFTIRPGATVEVRGNRALGIASHFDVYVGGILDLSAWATIGRRMGPGQTLDGAACHAPGFGNRSIHGGGGNVHAGGSGSNGAPGGSGGAGGYLRPLNGGCSGYTWASPLSGGGGAVQVVSRTRFTLASGGRIDVSGGGGDLSGTGGQAFGGGSGGGVLLEAPVISFASGGAITGRGGSGSALNYPNVWASGFEGPIEAVTNGASPVSCTGCGQSGRGGTESSAPGNALMTANPANAGGGGSVGRCVTRNATGQVSPPSGTMRIHHMMPVQVLAPRSP